MIEEGARLISGEGFDHDAALVLWWHRDYAGTHVAIAPRIRFLGYYQPMNYQLMNETYVGKDRIQVLSAWRVIDE